jgi:hypothetical protein
MRFLMGVVLAAQLLAQEELIDRIAVVVGKAIVKDSDIDRDIRVTEFLNHEPLRVDHAEQKKAAQRLVDQVLLREEIRVGGYGSATNEQVSAALEGARKTRGEQEGPFAASLKSYGLTVANLRDQLRWQLTVLRFVDARFQPAATVADSAADAYYRQHEAALRRAHPEASSEELHAAARTLMTDEEVNRLLFSWLDERRKSASVKFLEEGLA